MKIVIGIVFCLAGLIDVGYSLVVARTFFEPEFYSDTFIRPMIALLFISGLGSAFGGVTLLRPKRPPTPTNPPSTPHH